MKPVLTAALRPRICVGRSETLAVQTTACPRCQQTIQLMWPEYILQIPLHRVVSLDCPVCANSFSLIAADLVPVCEGGEGYVPGVVNQLS
jgi:C4-type Zn-finger protein